MLSRRPALAGLLAAGLLLTGCTIGEARDDATSTEASTTSATPSSTGTTRAIAPEQPAFTTERYPSEFTVVDNNYVTWWMVTSADNTLQCTFKEVHGAPNPVDNHPPRFERCGATYQDPPEVPWFNTTVPSNIVAYNPEIGFHEGFTSGPHTMGIGGERLAAGESVDLFGFRFTQSADGTFTGIYDGSGFTFKDGAFTAL